MASKLFTNLALQVSWLHPGKAMRVIDVCLHDTMTASDIIDSSKHVCLVAAWTVSFLLEGLNVWLPTQSLENYILLGL